MRQKEQLCTLRVYEGTIALETMFYADEVRSTKDLTVPGEDIKINDSELAMAKSLVDMHDPDDLDLADYKDDYREALLEIIQAKSEGQTIEAPGARHAPRSPTSPRPCAPASRPFARARPAKRRTRSPRRTAGSTPKPPDAATSVNSTKDRLAAETVLLLYVEHDPTVDSRAAWPEAPRPISHEVAWPEGFNFTKRVLTPRLAEVDRRLVMLM